MTQTPRSDPPDFAGWDRCISPGSFWLPDQIGPQVAWLEHAPFAFWLIETLRPRMLVELGTHGGFSYFVFCQAVQRLRLDTRCYAVDTWRGDAHAGLYDEEVFEEVRRYHDRRYASFSTLVRSTFDDAVAHVQDGTVDLLHIDGRHFYEDVRHDFDAWRPKLSDRGIVLFHDTNVRERGFGVSKLWAELRSAHRHFEFLHGSGLGVLGVGHHLPAPVDTLFRAADDAAAASQIRAVYSRLGSVVSLELRAQHQATELRQRKVETAAARTEADALRTELTARTDELRQWEIEVAALRKDIALRTEEAERVRSQLTAQVADADALRAETATLHAEIASGTLEAEAERRRWQTDADALRAETTALHAEVASGTLAAEAERRRWQTNAAILQQDLVSQRAETERLRDRLTARIADADALHAETKVLRAEVAGRRARAEALRRDVTTASAELHVMRNSRSWRFARPLRALRAAVWHLFGLERGARSAPPDLADAEPVESTPWLEGELLDAYFRTAELRGALLRARDAPLPSHTPPSDIDWAMYADRAAAESVAAVVRASDLFDGPAYAARVGHPDIDPALHYVLVGEHLGLKPSGRFDPAYYRERYPDIARARVNGLAHYLSDGRREGRRAVSVAAGFRYDRSRIDAGRDTILLIVHQASRTGAPILAYNIARRLRRTYNVVAVLLAGGELVPHFEEACSAVIGPLTYEDWHPVEAKYLVAEVTASCEILLAIVNSIESRLVVPALAARLVPTVILVHEFASYTRPAGAMGQALDWSTQVVFSADLVADAARREHPTLTGRPIHVLRQGQCDLPPGRTGGPAARSIEDLAPLFRPTGAENALVVLGCGIVQFRKGIDLFVSCAAAVAAAHPKRPVRFVWIGQGYDPEKDAIYSSYLADQIVHSGLEGVVAFVDEIPDLDPAYALADAFFVSSRLDPLPNVAIEAALRGLPVVCFEGATGMAEVLGADAIARRCVVPHLDAAAAARVIAEFADDELARAEVGDATRRLARAAFDMDNYVSRIEALGHAAVGLMRQRARDFETIHADAMFDEQVYVPPEHPPVTRDEAIIGFLARWTAVGLSRRAATNGLFRRPCAGFHPQVYAHEHAATYDAATVNPLADFIRRGQPRGPWLSDLITPAPGREGERRRPGLRIGVHAHFYYPELADDFLRKLASNSRACDLLLSTDSEAKAEQLREATAGYQRGEVRIRVVPNRGRDLGPLLTHFADEVARDYDLIGHVHGKRSLLIADGALGNAWREFLWQHLLGGLHPMMDVIVDRFADDDELGLVFAADPHLSDWDANLELATVLAKRMGIEGPLPPFFEFPNGTMFWARPMAVKPVFDLGLRWEDYPEEPVPIDGTMLHALERLLPFACRGAGFRFATTHVPSVTW